MRLLFCLPVLLLTTVFADDLPRTASSEDAEVYIVSPADGATVSSPVRIIFGLRNMGIAPAGVTFAGAGHHHLLIDTPVPALDQPIPADEHHRHFGKGQTEVLLELPPGRHTLQLLLGDALHIPHQPPVVSKAVTVFVR